MLIYDKVQAVDHAGIRFADGRVVSTQDLSILWCTGYRPDYRWIENRHGSLDLDRRGYPLHERGVARESAGLYFVGLRYQYTVASHDIFGVGRDAEYVARHIAGRLAGEGAPTMAAA